MTRREANVRQTGMQESVNVGAVLLYDRSAITGSQAFRIFLIRVIRAKVMNRDLIHVFNYVYQSDSMPP